MIRFARIDDFPRLMEIWRLCFGDSEKALRFLFDTLEKPENMLICTDERDAATATLSLEEFALCGGGREYKAAYVYGVATSPEQQGKGLSTRLLDAMHEILFARGFACSALVPAEKSLFGFYEKRGYENFFSINKAKICAGELAAGETLLLHTLTLPQFLAVRNAYFGDCRGLARWDEGYLDFILTECSFFGGGAYAFEFDGKACYAICYFDAGAAVIKEFAAPIPALLPLLRTLHARHGAEDFTVYLREDVQTTYTNNLLPFGMCRWYDNVARSFMREGAAAPGYLTHALD